jgi:hypothetical protein
MDSMVCQETLAFVHQSRLGSDVCALKAREHTNQKITRRSLWNTYERDNMDPQRAEKIKCFSTENLNLHYKNGYGVATPNLVDKDTDLRLNSMWTSEKAKTQMFHRFYLANPDLSRGVPKPGMESELMQGEDTATVYRQCMRMSELGYDRFTPMIPCLKETIQDPDHIVLPFNRGGEDSRQLMRDIQKNLKPCPRLCTTD